MGDKNATTVPGGGADASKIKNKETSKKSVLNKGISRDYFLGTLPNCPRQNLAFSGISFPRHTNDFKQNPENNVEVPVQKTGLVISLDGYKAEEVEKAIHKKVFRWTQGGKRADIVVKDEKYRAMEGDEPIAKYVYMIPVSEAVKIDPLFRDSDIFPKPVGPTS